MIDGYYLMVMVVAVCWQWGFAYAFKPGEIFGAAGDWMRARWPEFVTEPLFDCPYCLSSVHGSIFFWLFLSAYPLIMWPILICCLTGLSDLVKK